MALQTPLVLISGAFSTLPPGDTIGPATDPVAQASGNAALILAGTALASGNAGISTGLTALASGNAGLVSASNKVPISGGYMTGQLFAASGVVVSGTLSRNGFNVVTVGDVETVTSTMIASGTIIDADVNISGAINATKLNFLQDGGSAVARTVDSKLKDTVSVKDFGAVGDGVADDAAAIQSAIDFCHTTFETGKIIFPPGIYKINTKINLDQTRGIRLTGNGPGNTGAARTRIMWTGGSGSGTMLDLNRSSGTEIDHLIFDCNNAAYDGNLIDLGGTVAGDTTFVNIHDCKAGPGISTNATSLININYGYGIIIKNCFFQNGSVGIKGTNTVSSINISDCHFAQSCTNAIKAKGGTWNVINCIQQQSPAFVLNSFFSLAGECNGIVIRGCLLGVDGADAATSVLTSLIDLTGYTSSGISINGNSFSCNRGTAIRCGVTAGQTEGISIQGNVVSGMAVAFRLEGADKVSIIANKVGSSPINLDTATNISPPVVQTWSPTITNTSGTYGSITINEANYIRNGNQITVSIRVTVTAGTATGAMDITLPLGINALGFAFGTGQDITNGNAVMVKVNSNSIRLFTLSVISSNVYSTGATASNTTYGASVTYFI